MPTTTQCSLPWSSSTFSSWHTVFQFILHLISMVPLELKTFPSNLNSFGLGLRALLSEEYHLSFSWKYLHLELELVCQIQLWRFMKILKYPIPYSASQHLIWSPPQTHRQKLKKPSLQRSFSRYAGTCHPVKVASEFWPFGLRALGRRSRWFRRKALSYGGPCPACLSLWAGFSWNRWGQLSCLY